MNPLNHVAIIMDGNGRWGLKYRNSRNAGHKAGLNTVEKIIKASLNQKIKFLTLYAFSTENWKRPKQEILYLFKLLENFLIDRIDDLHRQNIKLKIIGSKKFSLKLNKLLNNAEKKTSNNSKLQINLAKQRLKNQNVELLYNFSSSPINNISILVFKENYKMNEKKVLKQCKKILKIERKIGKRKVNLKECRMHDQPSFADWSMYRENDSSSAEGVVTQQIIFLYKKKEYIFTSLCWYKCNKTKDDLFNLVKSISF